MAIGWSAASGSADLQEPDTLLDMGNSGTGARLVMGVVAGHDITAFFTGDASLRRRPMARVTEPLSRMGAKVVAREGGRLPLALTGAAAPLPITYASPVASAQVKSAILLAGLSAPGETTVIEPLASRDHTENLLRHFGAKVTVDADERRRQAHHRHRPARAQGRRYRHSRRSVFGRVSRGRGAVAAAIRDHDRRRRHQSAARRALRNPRRNGRRYHFRQSPHRRRRAGRRSRHSRRRAESA